MPKKIINPEDVDFVYIENITFGVVMKDDNGTDLTVSESEIQMDSFSREQLADNVMAHIQQSKPVEIIAENDNVITFEPDSELIRETD
tara:strand:- start:692 stop:955 length:264 start_codon:yes stop_codon:yes gene_type:complete